jgi:hypothetical protein
MASNLVADHCARADSKAVPVETSPSLEEFMGTCSLPQVASEDMAFLHHLQDRADPEMVHPICDRLWGHFSLGRTLLGHSRMKEGMTCLNCCSIFASDCAIITCNVASRHGFDAISGAIHPGPGGPIHL